MLLKFVDRFRELDFLNKIFRSSKPEFIVVYGRRRVGKSELIKQFMKGKSNCFYFLAKKQPIRLEFLRFKSKIGKFFNIFLEADDWEGLFREVGEKVSGRIVIVIDEFPYWIEKDKGIVSEFQFLWDEILSEQDVVLVLLGSYVSVMEQDVLSRKSPLYGRKTGQIELKPLDVSFLRDFFPSYSAEDLVRVYGCVDSIPYYLKNFDRGRDFWNNMLSSFLNPSNPLYDDAEVLLMEELREPNTYFNIIKSVLDGSTKINEISARSLVSVGNVPKYLKTLVKLRILRKVKPVTSNIKEKNYLYEVEDNYFRFWLTYVYPFKEEIERDPESHLSFIGKDYDRYLGKVFEDYVIKSFKSIDSSFHRVGRWWFKGDEIDLVALNQERKKILLGECKWSEGVNAEKVVRGLAGKSEKVQWFNEERKEEFAVFAKSFSKRIKEFEGKPVRCYDLRDLEKSIKVSDEKKSFFHKKFF